MQQSSRIFLAAAVLALALSLAAATNVRDPLLRWDGKIIPYTFDGLDATERGHVLAAISEMESKTCLKFVNWTTEQDYIMFVKTGPGCTSELGRVGGVQEINLASVCFRAGSGFGTTLHQLGHAIGLTHEQSRPDRNQFVRVRPWAIDPAFRSLGLYGVDSHESVDRQGIPYDYGSIMHFKPDAFARAGQKVLKIKRPYSGEIGQRNSLSRSDVEAINRFYQCPTEGVPGRLLLHLRTLKRLPSFSGFVQVTAFKSTGEAVVMRSVTARRWYDTIQFDQKLDFGSATWSYYRVSIGYDSTGGEEFSLPETRTVARGSKNMIHCSARNGRRCSRGMLLYNVNFR